MTQCGVHGSMEYVKQLEAERDALRARIEDVDGMAKAMNGGLEMHEECGSCEALRRKARAVSAWLKEGK